jgi:hypothetical protein
LFDYVLTSDESNGIFSASVLASDSLIMTDVGAGYGGWDPITPPSNGWSTIIDVVNEWTPVPGTTGTWTVIRQGT